MHKAMPGNFFICGLYHRVMKADLRISIKDFQRNQNLKIQLVHVPFCPTLPLSVRLRSVAGSPAVSHSLGTVR